MDKKKLNIYIVTPDPHNNISFYRSWGPLIKMEEKKYPVHIDVRATESIINSYSFLAYAKDNHIFMFSCPYTMAHLECIKWLKSEGRKVWLDFDDLITQVPVWNVRGFLEYSKHPVSKVVEEAIRMADLVTVSTDFLKMEWSHLNKNMYVVENAFDAEFLDKPAPIGTSNQVLYRGGESHNLDLWDYREPILKSMKANTRFSMHFVGMNPIYINQELNHTWTPQLSKPNYWKFLENNTAKILIVPLKDIPFNHAKSCIAWLEATYAGCAVLAPDWVEWQKPGILNYSNKVDFEKKLVAMMSGRINLAERVNKSREYIMNCQTLEKVNETRWNLIQKHLI